MCSGPSPKEDGKDTDWSSKTKTLDICTVITDVWTFKPNEQDCFLDSFVLGESLLG